MEDAELIGRQMPQIESGVPLPKRLENPNKIPNLDTHFGPWDSVQDGMTVMNAYGKPGRLFGVKGSVMDEDVTSYEVDYYVYRGQSLAPRLLGSSNGSISIQISVTKSELDDLITDNELVPNVLYEISGCDESLYGGTTLYLKAISNNKLETSGIGKFYNPKYDQEVEGYGIFDIDTIYDVDDTCIWGGKHWTCIAETSGEEPMDQFTLDAKAWQEIPFNETDYNVAYDEIKYDYENDWIAERHEVKSGNIVSCSKATYYLDEDKYDVLGYNAIKLFQWGNIYNSEYGKGLSSNSVIESWFDCINSKCYCIYGNVVQNQSYIYNNDIISRDFSANFFNNNSCLCGNKIQSDFMHNNLENGSRIGNNVIDDYSFNNCNFNRVHIYSISQSVKNILSYGFPKNILGNSGGQVVIQYINQNNQLTIIPITS